MDALLSNLRTNDPKVLCGLLSVDLRSHSYQIASVQSSLRSVDASQIKSHVEQYHLNDDWSSFEPLVVSYLLLCKDVDPWSILQSHDLYLSFFNALSMAFMNSQYGESLCPLFQETVGHIIPMVKRVDLVLNRLDGKKNKRLVFVSTVLSRVFNHLRALKGSPRKKELIIFIVNHLNSVYFTIGNPLLCANIFANVNLLELKFQRFPMSQQVQYRYILARYYIIKNQLSKAHHHLSWSFRHCLKGSTNLIRILRYLVPVSMLIGKNPSKQVLMRFPELQAMYGPLVIHSINGNQFEFQRHLFLNQHYFKSRGLLVLLSQRSRILLFRNLALKVFQTCDVNRLPYAKLQVAFAKSLRTSTEQSSTFGNQALYQTLNEPVDLAFVQNVCCSLIENDMVKGNVVASSRLVILSKSNPFPSVYANYTSKYGINGNEKWMDY